jgi:hypothetical protein
MMLDNPAGTDQDWRVRGMIGASRLWPAVRVWGKRLLRKTIAAEEQTTASCGLWPWVELTRRHNVDIERLCAFAGTELSRLRQPFARWSQTSCNLVARFACDEFGEDAAMAAALTVEAGHFQLLELLIRTAPTVGDGLRIGCLFFPLLHAGGRLLHECTASGVQAVTWHPPKTYTVHRAYVELTFGITLLGIRREANCPAASAAEVSFRHSAPANTALYQRVLGVLPRFEMDEDRMVFDRSIVTLKMARGNPTVHAQALAVAEELIESDAV